MSLSLDVHGSNSDADAQVSSEALGIQGAGKMALRSILNGNDTGNTLQTSNYTVSLAHIFIAWIVWMI
jgi:hypothetical protein